MVIVGIIGFICFILIKFKIVKDIIFKLVNPIFVKYFDEDVEKISKSSPLSKTINEELKNENLRLS